MKRCDRCQELVFNHVIHIYSEELISSFGVPETLMGIRRCAYCKIELINLNFSSEDFICKDCQK